MSDAYGQDHSPGPQFTPAKIGPLPTCATGATGPVEAPFADPNGPQKPDPAKADLLMADSFGHLVALVEGIVASVPMLHNLSARAAAMRASFDKALFHNSPPAPPPPPPRDPARVAILEDIPVRTQAEDAELKALTAA